MPPVGAHVHEASHGGERVQVDVAHTHVVCLRLALRNHDAERVDDLRMSPHVSCPLCGLSVLHCTYSTCICGFKLTKACHKASITSE